MIRIDWLFVNIRRTVDTSGSIPSDAADGRRKRMATVEESAPPRWLLPIPQACSSLGVGRSTLYELAARGDVQIVRVGRRALVPVASIEAFVERLRAGDGGGVPAA